MGLEELLPYVLASAAMVSVVLIVLYVTRRRKEPQNDVIDQSPKLEAVERWRFRVDRSISTGDAKDAREELRTLGLEREILSDAIRHLYEAHAEGKITEEERERLAKRYKSRMMTVKEAITENESLVALHELEAMQEDLMKLFDERFNELSTKIETLRSQVGLKAEETMTPSLIPIPTQMETEPSKKEAPAKKTRRKSSRKPQKSRKTEAEERIEKIRTEVEKVLDRLEQMEVET